MHQHSVSDLIAMVESLEAQLKDLYSERAEMPVSPQEQSAAITSLEAQVICLIDERDELSERIMHLNRKIASMKEKSKALGAALLEAALFGPDGETDGHGGIEDRRDAA